MIYLNQVKKQRRNKLGCSNAIQCCRAMIFYNTEFCSCLVI